MTHPPFTLPVPAEPATRLPDVSKESGSELAGAEKLPRGYIGRLLQLALLAPDIAEAVLDRRQSEQLHMLSSMKMLSAG
jgi:hypothetical protein